MEKFTILRGTAAPLMRSNVDTGTIIPNVWLRSRSFDLGEKMFYNWRYELDGTEKPDFVLNQPRYRKAQILVAGVNFGCGSSREAAVWALMRFGIRCVVAPSFGEIFYDNAFQNGLLPVQLPPEQVERIASAVERSADPTLTVDLLERFVECDGLGRLPFDIAEARRTALLEGLGETDLILRYADELDAWEEQDRRARPWIYLRDDGAGNPARPAAPAR